VPRERDARRIAARQAEELASWEGRDLFDAYGEKIGTVSGLGYRRERFGTFWLVVRGTGPAALVPAAQVSQREGRLVLPYARSYVEDALAPGAGGRLSRAEERRLLFHYGLDSELPDGGCPQRCGLCSGGRGPAAKH